ncbi:MAG: hypothetical protein AABW67_04090 [Nanoarchaeota archaeon]
MKNKHKIVIIFALVILSSLLIGGFLKNPKQTGNSVAIPTINITTQNLAVELPKSSMLKALPKDMPILLKFYNLNSGGKQWENSYLIKDGKMKEIDKASQDKTTENVEITIALNSKYLDGLTNKNLCSVIKKANQNGDLSFETSLSKISLAWKFKGVMKYRECL